MSDKTKLTLEGAFFTAKYCKQKTNVLKFYRKFAIMDKSYMFNGVGVCFMCSVNRNKGEVIWNRQSVNERTKEKGRWVV